MASNITLGSEELDIAAIQARLPLLPKRAPFIAIHHNNYVKECKVIRSIQGVIGVLQDTQAILGDKIKQTGEYQSPFKRMPEQNEKLRLQPVIVSSSASATSKPAPLTRFFPAPSYSEFIKETSKGVIRGEVRFGAAEWKKYFGDVGVEPPLPENVTEIDNAPCPFSNDPQVKVKDTHMWVLIPAYIHRGWFGLKIPLTLNTLLKIIRAPLVGENKAGFNDIILEEYGDMAPEASYWALMTRDVIPGSKRKSFDEQKALITSHAGYVVPGVLAVAVCLSVEYAISSTRLLRYGHEEFKKPKPPEFPWQQQTSFGTQIIFTTYTRCEEKRILIGNFRRSCFLIKYESGHKYGRSPEEYHNIGIVALRKF